VKALILDMDGVIVDSEHQWKLIETPFLRGLLGRWEESDHQRVVGLNVVDLYHLLVRDYGLKQSQEDFLARSAEQALEIYRNRVSCAPGLPELLAAMKASGVALGIASSSPKPWIAIVLERFSLASHFQAVVSSDDVGRRAKPLPDVYLKAAELLGAAPSDCTAVEDSVIGIKAAKAAGMSVLGFRNSHNDNLDFSQTTAEIRSLLDILELNIEV
jgi:HAD superfamily hydrolase (TIGR01509 family)